MTRFRFTPVLLATAVAASLLLTAPGAEAAARTIDGRVDDWTGTSSRVAGSVQYSDGEFIHQDHVFDDAGAADVTQSPQQRGSFEGRTSGSYRYPTDEARYGQNAADLLELRLATSADTVYGLVRLNTLLADDTTVAALALDLDGAVDTVGAWPRNADVATPGADVVITVWGVDGEITDLHTGTSTPIDVAVDTDENAIEFALPRHFLPGASWRVWAGTGLWDGTGWMAVPRGRPDETTPGHGDAGRPRLFNAAFRETESGQYFEDRQADALAAADLARFSATIDVTKLDQEIDEAFTIPTGEPVVVVMEQSFDIGGREGTTHGDEVPGRHVGSAGLGQFFRFFGRHQPYTLRLPSDWHRGTAWPMVVALHGHSGTHGNWVTDESFADQVLEHPHHDSLVAVAPLGRGASFYADWGEADVYEVLADVESFLDIDSSRRYLAGYSMGGYGAYRLASTRPDMWAAMVSYAGPSGDTSATPQYHEILTDDPGGVDATYRETTGLGGGRAATIKVGDMRDLMTNVREVPVLQASGTNDEIVGTYSQTRATQALDDLDFRHRLDLYPGYEHLSFALLGNWAGSREWFADHRAPTAPHRVTYSFSERISGTAARGLGVTHDGAYWVSGLARRESVPDDDFLDIKRLGTIDAVSHGIVAPVVDVRPVRDVSTERHPHVRQGDDWDASPAHAPTSNALDLDLDNVATAVIDAARADLTPRGLVITVDTDGPTRIRVTGDFGSMKASSTLGDTAVDADGSLVISIDDAGRATITVDGDSSAGSDAP